MKLIDNLLLHINDNNALIIKDISDIITNNKINSLEDLESFEDNYNKYNNSVLSLEEKVNKCKDILLESIYDMDYLSFNNIDDYRYNIELLKKKDETLEERVKAVIKLYQITKRDIALPYTAYNLIIEGKL